LIPIGDQAVQVSCQGPAWLYLANDQLVVCQA
jgi:hypothetical protein